ncbi:MAG: transporter [Bacteroidales bacterium]|nr:transporter [Bacteroidales bacterium]
MKRLYLFFVLSVSLNSLFAQQTVSSWSADRPGAATGPDITPFMKVAWETGFESCWDGSHSFTLPTTMLRFGVTNFAEIRLEYDGTLCSLGNHDWAYNVEPLVLGAKMKVYEGKGWIPKVSFMANLTIPLMRHADPNTVVPHVAPSFYLLFQNDVTDWFNIGYNVGVEWSGISHIPATFLALCLGFNITDNLGAFVESYNYLTRYGKGNTVAECDLDFGFSYTVHPRVQLDLYGMFNCQDPRSYNGLGLGVAWLIN